MAVLKFHWPPLDTVRDETFISKCPLPERNVSNNTEAEGRDSVQRIITKHCTSTRPVVSILQPVNEQLQESLLRRLAWALIVLWRKMNTDRLKCCCESLVKWREQRRKYKIEPLCFYPIFKVLGLLVFQRLPPHEGCKPLIIFIVSSSEDYFLDCRLLYVLHYKMSAINSCSSKSKMTSSNILFYPQSSDIEFTVTEEERNQELFTFKKLNSESYPLAITG